MDKWAEAAAFNKDHDVILSRKIIVRNFESLAEHFTTFLIIIKTKIHYNLKDKKEFLIQKCLGKCKF